MPALGGETIRPLCPLPIGATRSSSLPDNSSLDVSNLNLSLGKIGVSPSKLGRSLATSGS